MDCSGIASTTFCSNSTVTTSITATFSIILGGAGFTFSSTMLGAFLNEEGLIGSELLSFFFTSSREGIFWMNDCRCPSFINSNSTSNRGFREDLYLSSASETKLKPFNIKAKLNCCDCSIYFALNESDTSNNEWVFVSLLTAKFLKCDAKPPKKVDPSNPFFTMAS